MPYLQMFLQFKIIMKIDKTRYFNYSEIFSDTILLKEKKALYHVDMHRDFSIDI